MELKDLNIAEIPVIRKHLVNPQWNWKDFIFFILQFFNIKLILNGIESRVAAKGIRETAARVNPQWNWKERFTNIIPEESWTKLILNGIESFSYPQL